jgi:hypothetical protein
VQRAILRYCSQGCRPSSQNGSNDPIQRGAENSDLAALRPLENIDAELDHFQEFQTSRPRANSQKELHFEEWPPRVRMKAPCISYKLTDGKQINTGYGRASSPHGYVMEISPGRWVARVSNFSSEPLTLGAAKKAAVELRCSKDPGQPRDWIYELNRKMVAEIDRAHLAQEKRRVPINLMGGHRWPTTLAINPELRASIMETELWWDQEIAPIEILKGDDYPLQTYSDGYPKLPACLDRRPRPALAEAA